MARACGLLLGLALLPLAALAPLAAQQAPPRFLLEKIVVEGLRRSGADQLVVAESLLREGEAYGEDDLRQAVYRIKRLPFILDAEFALRKGSERGRYELLIGVEEVKPYFFQYTAVIDVHDRPFRGGSIGERVDDTGFVGARYFVNSHDLAFAAWNPEGFVNLGYTRFNLFGRGGYLSVQGSFSSAHDRVVALTAAVPLVGNHALRSTTNWSRFDGGEGFGETLEWLYNTTDDPLLPTAGSATSVAASYDDNTLSTIVTPLGGVRHLEQQSTGLAAQGTRYWPLGLRQSLSAGAGLHYTRHLPDSEDVAPGRSRVQRSYGGTIDVGYAVSLWRTQGFGPRRDLRLEGGLAFNDERFSAYFGRAESRSWAATLGLVFRNAWSLIRITFGYSEAVGGFR